MFGYYLKLALRSLQRNVVLTALMILAIAVGIGASITTLAIFRAMSGDPIPEKSGELFSPQIDDWGPEFSNGPGRNVAGTPDKLPDQLSYIDAMALMRAHEAKRQAAMFGSELIATPSDSRQRPFYVLIRATYADFFTMFDVPFRFGGPWAFTDDENALPRVVLEKDLNDKLFGGADSVGKTAVLGGRRYVITGVTEHWQPTPPFYDLNSRSFGGPDQAFIPFTIAAHQGLSHGSVCGPVALGSGKDAMLNSDCNWTEMWVELPTAASVRHYRDFLQAYSRAQHDSGRFNWQARTALRNVTQWLSYERVVPDEVHILLAVAFSFLLVCLLNAMALMLAKFLAGSGTVAVRRALGADRSAVLSQCLVEAGMVGVAGGVIGVGFTQLGLMGSRMLLPENYAGLTRMGGANAFIAVSVAVIATVLAGLYPTFRTAHLPPAWQLKSQ